MTPKGQRGDLTLDVGIDGRIMDRLLPPGLGQTSHLITFSLHLFQESSCVSRWCE